jgi:hypothetical protein
MAVARITKLYKSCSAVEVRKAANKPRRNEQVKVTGWQAPKEETIMRVSQKGLSRKTAKEK